MTIPIKDKIKRDYKVRSAEVIPVIKTLAVIGEGTDEDPVRHCYQYWSLESELLATVDTLGGGNYEHYRCINNK